MLYRSNAFNSSAFNVTSLLKVRLDQPLLVLIFPFLLNLIELKFPLVVNLTEVGIKSNPVIPPTKFPLSSNIDSFSVFFLPFLTTVFKYFNPNFLVILGTIFPLLPLVIIVGIILPFESFLFLMRHRYIVFPP